MKVLFFGLSTNVSVAFSILNGSISNEGAGEAQSKVDSTCSLITLRAGVLGPRMQYTTLGD